MEYNGIGAIPSATSEENMKPLTCPNCGQQSASEVATCPDCGHALNGVAPSVTPPTALHSIRPAGVPDGRLPPELHEWEQQHFDKEAFLAGLREVEQTGGLELKDFIDELEQGVSPRE
jgi:hypothetical protein